MANMQHFLAVYVLLVCVFGFQLWTRKYLLKVSCMFFTYCLYNYTVSQKSSHVKTLCNSVKS